MKKARITSTLLISSTLLAGFVSPIGTTLAETTDLTTLTSETTISSSNESATTEEVVPELTLPEVSEETTITTTSEVMEEPIKVTKEEPEEDVTLYITHVDSKTGNIIADDTILTGKEGTTWNQPPLTIEGYQFNSEMSDSQTGVFGETNGSSSFVWYRYDSTGEVSDPNKETNFTIHADTWDERPLLDESGNFFSVTYTGKVGEVVPVSVNDFPKTLKDKDGVVWYLNTDWLNELISQGYTFTPEDGGITFNYDQPSNPMPEYELEGNLWIDPSNPTGDKYLDRTLRFIAPDGSIITVDTQDKAVVSNGENGNLSMFGIDSTKYMIDPSSPYFVKGKDGSYSISFEAFQSIASKGSGTIDIKLVARDESTEESEENNNGSTESTENTEENNNGSTESTENTEENNNGSTESTKETPGTLTTTEKQAADGGTSNSNEATLPQTGEKASSIWALTGLGTITTAVLAWFINKKRI